VSGVTPFFRLFSRNTVYFKKLTLGIKQGAVKSALLAEKNPWSSKLCFGTNSRMRKFTLSDKVSSLESPSVLCAKASKKCFLAEGPAKTVFFFDGHGVRNSDLHRRVLAA
jgi:hypothetical protein